MIHIPFICNSILLIFFIRTTLPSTSRIGVLSDDAHTFREIVRIISYFFTISNE